MDILAFILSFVALILAFVNSGKLNNLERRLANIQKKHIHEPQKGVKQNSNTSVRGLRHETFAPRTTEVFSEQSESSGKRASAFIIWLKSNPLMKLGVAFVLMAFAWFVRFAYVNEWIGEHTVIFGALLIATLVMLFGFYDSLKLNNKRGLIILGTGVSMAVLSVFAGRFLYDLYSSGATFVMLVIPLAFSAFAAYKFNSAKFMVFVYGLAALSPFLTLSDTGSFFSLFAYLLLINLSALTLSFLRGWHILSSEALVSTALYSIVAFFSFRVDIQEVVFAYLLLFIFAVSAFVALVRFARDGDTESRAIARNYLMLGLLNTTLIAIWTFMGAPKDIYSPLLLLWSFVFLVLGFSSFVFYANKKAFYVFSASAMLFLGFITIVELEFELMLAAFSIEALLALFASYFISSKDKEITLKSAKLFFVPALMSAAYLIKFFGAGFGYADSMAVSVYVFMLTLALAGYFIYSSFSSDKKAIKTIKCFAATLFVWILALVWLVPHDIVYNYDLGTLISLVIYALIGIALYFNKGDKFAVDTQKLGAIVLIILVVRVLLVDVWELSLAFRIVTFALIGIALISTAYRIGHEKKKYEAINDNNL